MRRPSWLRWAQRSTYESELEEELAYHIQARADDLVKEGASMAEALVRARREFGPKELAKDYCRDHDGVQWFDELARNLSFAVRRFVRRPGLFVSIVVTLGLCFAVNVVILGVVVGVLWQALPYPKADELQIVHSTIGEDVAELRDYLDGRTWFALEEGTTTLEMAVYSGWVQEVNFVVPGSADVAPSAVLLAQQRVGAGFFSVLGVPLARGRSFTPIEDSSGGPAVVVVSWNTWQNQFDGREDVVGSAIDLAGEPHTVVGITGELFKSRTEAEVWIPLRASTSGEGSGTNYQVLARVPTGAGSLQAELELGRVAELLAAERGIEGFGLLLMPLEEYQSAWIKSPIMNLWSAVALLLLIGCVNVAGLLLSTTEQRASEVATRRALGGGMGSLTRQLMTESLFLAGCGAILGLGLAVFGLRWLEAFCQETLGLWQSFPMDFKVVGMVGLLTVVATLVFGLVPAIVIARNPSDHLKARGTSMGSGRTTRFLVVAQVALGLGLLLTAGLLVRTWNHLASEDPGVQLEGILSATVSLRDARFDSTAEIVRYFEAGKSLLEQSPQILSAGAVLSLPFERHLNLSFHYDGGENVRTSAVSYVTPEALGLLGVRLIDGRFLTAGDVEGAPLVALVNESFVRLYTEGSVFGRAVRLGGGSGVDEDVGIVGVVADVRQRPSFSGSAPLASDVPTMYLPIGQVSDQLMALVHTWFKPSWVIKTASSTAAVEATIREGLAAADPLTPIASLRHLSSVRADALAMERFLAFLFSIIALLAVTLAAVGVAGTTASAVSRRKKEFGLRLALGSTVSSAVVRVALPSLWLVAVGVAVGLLVAQAGTRSVAHMLHGVGTHDLITHIAAAGGLMLVAGIACVVPALRVARLSVVSTLQDDS